MKNFLKKITHVILLSFIYIYSKNVYPQSTCEPGYPNWGNFLSSITFQGNTGAGYHPAETDFIQDFINVYGANIYSPALCCAAFTFSCQPGTATSSRGNTIGYDLLIYDAAAKRYYRATCENELGLNTAIMLTVCRSSRSPTHEYLYSYVGPNGYEGTPQGFYITVRPEQNTYGDKLFRADQPIQLWEWDNVKGIGRLVGQRTITIEIPIKQVINLSLVPTGYGFSSGDTSETLDFNSDDGKITLGETRSFDVLVETNVGYRISMRSENAYQGYSQSLVHSSGNTTLPYSISVNSVNQDLRAGNFVQVKTGGGIYSTTTPARVPVTITAGNPANRLAGYYEENITISVLAY